MRFENYYGICEKCFCSALVQSGNFNITALRTLHVFLNYSIIILEHFSTIFGGLRYTMGYVQYVLFITVIVLVVYELCSIIRTSCRVRNVLQPEV